MAFSEIEIKKIEKPFGKYLERRRPPPHLRDKVDISFRIHGQSVEIFEVRPQWRNPSELVEAPFAKASLVKTTGKWRVFWQRADLKWHAYQPCPYVDSIDDFVALVDADEHGCFRG